MNIVKIQRCARGLMIVAALSMLACTDKGESPLKAKTPPATAADIDPRSQVIGVVPAGPTAETAATTSAAKSDMSKAQQSGAMPLPGQANDHSTLSPKASQKTKTTGS